MNREFLKELGLEDEAIDKVMAEHGKTVNATKEELKNAQTEAASLKEELKNRDSQLEQLSKQAGDNESLKEQLNALKEANRQKSEEFEKQLQQQTFNYKLENELLKAEVHNPKAVRALLDTESIKLDGDQLMGLTDQLNKLKETDGYLFKSNEKPGGYKPGPDQKGNQPKEKTLADIGRQRALERHGQKEEN